MSDYVSMAIKDDQERGQLFDQLLRYYGESEDRRGWVHVACPNCGKEGKRKDIHFSFSYEYGCKCLACGYTANLKQLADKLGLLGDEPAPAAPRRKREEEPVKTYGWMKQLDQILFQMTADQSRYFWWGSYRNFCITPEIINRHCLVYGKFPKYSSQCEHNRLLVPIFQAGRVVGFRGRAVDDACKEDGHKKWLSTAMGNRPPVLFGGAVLLPESERQRVAEFDLADSCGPYVRDRVLFIVENPVDQILLESAGACVVATLGVTMWTSARPWTALLKEAKPKRVVVLYDHDLPGNGASSEGEYRQMVGAWKREHKDQDPPLSNGLRLANELNAVGIPAQKFHWPVGTPLKADIGDFIQKFGVKAVKDSLG